jgi:glycosyltransferase involved in cell wall biosynthesis
MDSLHVVHLIPLIALGGVWRHLQAISRLKSKRLRHTIVSLFKTKVDRAEELLSAPVFRLDLPGYRANNGNLVHEKLLELFRAISPDLVHSHHYSSDIFALPAAKDFGVPAIRTVHGITQAGASNPLTRSGPRLDWCSRQIRTELNLEGPMVRTLTVCRALRDKLLRYGFAPDRVSTLYLGIDLTEAKSIQAKTKTIPRQRRRGRVIVGFAGRLEPIKNPLMMCRLGASLKAHKHRPKIRIVGSGSLQQKLEQTIRTNGLEDSVTIRAGGAEMQNEISHFDVLVVPSLLEGIPLVALEAMAFSIPVIASAVGGIPELISNGSNGLLFRSNDVRGLSEKVLSLLESEDCRKRLGRCGYATVKRHFSLATQLKKLERVYMETCIGLS